MADWSVYIGGECIILNSRITDGWLVLVTAIAIDYLQVVNLALSYDSDQVKHLVRNMSQVPTLNEVAGLIATHIKKGIKLFDLKLIYKAYHVIS